MCATSLLETVIEKSAMGAIFLTSSANDQLFVPVCVLEEKVPGRSSQPVKKEGWLSSNQPSEVTDD
jgi:hypothetical protein